MCASNRSSENGDDRPSGRAAAGHERAHLEHDSRVGREQELLDDRQRAPVARHHQVHPRRAPQLFCTPESNRIELQSVFSSK